MKVAIVVVTYQGKQWLKTCLGSSINYAPQAKLYVVDNGSSDGTAEAVAADYPTVQLIKLKENLGFSGGNNIGLKQALIQGAEAVLLLNQDAELTAGALEKMVAALQSNSHWGAVQAGLYLPNGLVNSLGNQFHYLGFAYAGGNGRTYEQAKGVLSWLKSGGEPPYLSGAGLLLRAAALREVGLLDQEFFMYHEDLELSWRLRLNGWQLGVLPEARIIHHYQMSRSLNQFYYMERNRLVLVLSYYRLPTLLLLLIPWLISEAVLLAVAFWSGWGLNKIKAYLYCLSNQAWRNIIARRQKLTSLRKISDRRLLAYACGRIDFQGDNSPLTDYIFNPLSSLAWQLLYPLIRW